MRALSELGFERVELAIGGSLGGMRALQWALDAPQRVGAAIVVGAHDHHSAMGIALNRCSGKPSRSIRCGACVSRASSQCSRIRARNSSTNATGAAAIAGTAVFRRRGLFGPSGRALRSSHGRSKLRCAYPCHGLVRRSRRRGVLTAERYEKTRADVRWDHGRLALSPARRTASGPTVRSARLRRAIRRVTVAPRSRRVFGRAGRATSTLRTTYQHARYGGSQEQPMLNGKSHRSPALGFSTRAIWSGQDACPATGATIVPVYQTATFTLPESG